MTQVIRIDVAGRATEVRVTGPEDAPSVVLLHGGGIDCAAMSWFEMTPFLATRFRVIAPDLPGYGGTEGFGRPHTVEDLGRWAAALVETLCAGPVAVAGCSMGGATALWLALERPDLVRAVVPIASYGLARRAALHPLVAMWPQTGGGRLVPLIASANGTGGRVVHSLIFADPSRVTDQMVSAFRKEAARQTRNQSFRDFLKGEVRGGHFQTCFLDRLGGLTVPALFVHGRMDGLVGYRHARHAAAQTPGAQLLTVTAGHWPHRERPEIVGPALVDFLSQGVLAPSVP